MATAENPIHARHHVAKPSTPMKVLAGLLLVPLGFVAYQMVIIDSMNTISMESLGIGLELVRDNPNHPRRSNGSAATAGAHNKQDSERASKGLRHPSLTSAIFDESAWEDSNHRIADMMGIKANSCGYEKGLKTLKSEEVNPKAGSRHMVDPPSGGKLSLVCCDTTKGPLAMLAHHNWAPLGTERFLEMVTTGYFDSGVPMMRCVKGFLCQFGLNNDPKVSKKFEKSIKDDPNWLPEGPKYRENKNGVKRFARGYLAYAGSGKNSRGNQLIMSLHADGPLGGGSPWEVPWGELVGKKSFETLSKIYTGYDEKGPSQGKLMNRGMDEELKEEFPKLDYITKCVLVDERES